MYRKVFMLVLALALASSVFSPSVADAPQNTTITRGETISWLVSPDDPSRNVLHAGYYPDGRAATATYWQGEPMWLLGFAPTIFVDFFYWTGSGWMYLTSDAVGPFANEVSLNANFGGVYIIRFRVVEDITGSILPQSNSLSLRIE